jgi:hypothetical protein
MHLDLQIVEIEEDVEGVVHDVFEFKKLEEA